MVVRPSAGGGGALSVKDLEGRPQPGKSSSLRPDKLAGLSEITMGRGIYTRRGICWMQEGSMRTDPDGYDGPCSVSFFRSSEASRLVTGSFNFTVVALMVATRNLPSSLSPWRIM